MAKEPEYQRCTKDWGDMTPDEKQREMAALKKFNIELKTYLKELQEEERQPDFVPEAEREAKRLFKLGWDDMTPDERQKVVDFYKRFLHFTPQQALREAKFMYRLRHHGWQGAQELANKDSPTMSELAESRQRYLAKERKLEEYKQKRAKKKKPRQMLGGMDTHPAVGSSGTMTVHHPAGNFDIEVLVKDVRTRWFRTEYYVVTTEPIGPGRPNPDDIVDDPLYADRLVAYVMHPPDYAEAWVNAKRVHLSS